MATVPAYRADLDGLRGIAVLAVVGFHAFPVLLTGGFVGVDIFFVLSGFLISTTIFDNMQKGRFSLADFYRRRIRRIFPALVVVLGAAYAVGWFGLLANEYARLGKHIAAAAGFVSNFVFWTESGYFDTATELKPLAHLWSLGIEEQFYACWPLLLWLAWRRRRVAVAIAASAGILSFACNLFTVHADAVGAFFSPQTRVWELAVGSVLALVLLGSKHPSDAGGARRNVVSLAGAALVAAGILVIDKNDAFPGWWALLPTAGTAAMISGGTGAWLNRSILSNRSLAWFGLISYPLYLWHWPLLSFARIIESGPLRYDLRVGASVAAIVLAWLTYKLVEMPLRFGRFATAKTTALVVAMAVIGIAGGRCFNHDGLAGSGFRAGAEQAYARYFENDIPQWRYFENTGMLEKYRFECDFYDVAAYRRGHATAAPVSQIDKSCYERDPNRKNAVVLWGDSHAKQLYFGLKNNLPDDWQILQVTSSGCSPSVGADETSHAEYCARSNRFALETIERTRPDVVIVAENLNQRIEVFRRIAAKLESAGVGRTIFMGPSPHWTSDLPNIVIRRLWNDTPTRTLAGIDRDVLIANSRLQAEFRSSGAGVFVNLIDFFCNRSGCLTYLGGDKKTGITSWDYGHLTPVASDYLAKNLLAGVVTGDGIGAATTAKR
jgi:peptidoglycan/LPS O-acetylase OafA/YrhL